MPCEECQQAYEAGRVAALENEIPINELNAAEALMGFLCWLTTRKIVASFSCFHDASIAVQLFEKFKSYNNLGEIRSELWPNFNTPD